MISLEDRQRIARAVQEAHRGGARLEYACAEAGITVRTLQRWRRCEGLERGDCRPQAVSLAILSDGRGRIAGHV